MLSKLINAIINHKIKALIYIPLSVYILLHFKKVILWLSLVSFQTASVNLFFPTAEVYCIIGAYNKFKANNLLSAETYNNLNKEIEINEYDFKNSSPLYISGITNNKIVFFYKEDIMRYRGKTNTQQCIKATKAYFKVVRNSAVPEVVLINKK